jgi:suppressor of G2 allele of SKP1
MSFRTALKKTTPVVVPIKEQDSQPTPETESAASEPAGKESQSTAGLSYPTSSRSGPKNWDKLEGLEGNDSEDESDVNQFFKKIYKGATPEQQRAMMKSFTESNGTSLSTDWDDVKGRTVETVPPEGVEAKKWT